MGSETRLRIVTEAARLFHEQGFAATSVADVLAAADVHSGSLYHFFASKTALLEAVLERHRELLRPALLEPAEATAVDPVDRVFALLGHYRRSLAASACTRSCPVARLCLEIGPHEARARAVVDRYFADWAGAVGRWLEPAHGWLPHGHDRQALARHVLAVLQGATMQAIASGRLEPFDVAVGQLRSYLMLLQAGARTAAAARAPEAPNAGMDVPSEETTGPADTGWRSW